MTTLDDHIRLLEEKGYLTENFKPGTHAAYWLRDLQERFELCRTQSQLEGGAKNFFMETMGRFNQGLELVFITFRFNYDPQADSLALKSVNARMGKFTKSYMLPTSGALKAAADIHQTLSKALGLERLAFYHRLQKDFQRDRNPANDYDSAGGDDLHNDALYRQLLKQVNREGDLETSYRSSTEDGPGKIGKQEISGDPFYQHPKTTEVPPALKKYLKR